jgi:acyl-coenzyme A synthetase/AMP-(fatty) acid ligase
MNITDRIREHAQTMPDKAALERKGQVVSYAQLQRLIENCHASLLEHGLRTGDRVAIALPTDLQSAVIILGLASLGVALCPVSPATGTETLSDLQAQLGFSLLISAEEWQIEHPMPCLHRNAIVGGAGTGTSQGPGASSPDHGDLPLLLAQTSGTTGEPKRFFLTHRQVGMRLEEFIRELAHSTSTRALGAVEFTFFQGVQSVFNYTRLGGTIVYPGNSDLDEFVRCVKEKSINSAFAWPQRLESLLERRRETGADLPPELRLLSSTSWLNPVTKQAVRAELSCGLLELYACNEAGVMAADMPWEEAPPTGAVGRVLDGVEMEIVDANHAPVPAGTAGRIRIRKAAGFIPTGYIDNPEADALAFHDGWFYPGDVGSMDERGNLWLKGRVDDVINLAGRKIYPFEIEQVLLSHPAVIEAAAFGIPDKHYGEVPAACVEVTETPDTESLGQLCKEKLTFNAPLKVAVVREMPRNRAGKILKRQLREELLGFK